MSEKPPEFLDLTLTDWRSGRRLPVQLVPSSSTLGEVIGDAIPLLGLPRTSFFTAVAGGRELPNQGTLEELGVESGAEISIVPVLVAG